MLRFNPYVTILILLVWGGLYACGSSKQNPRAKDPKQTAQAPKVEEPTTAKEEPEDEPESGAPTKKTPKVVDESKLPDYILRKADLEDLTPLVEPRVNVNIAGGNDFSTARNSQEFSRFLLDFTNNSMKLPVLSPGRVFSVVVIPDGTLNALMTVDYQLGINTGTILKGTPDEVLAVVCHEMAHGARNHSYKASKTTAELIPTNLQRQIEQYLTRQFDRNTGIYTHNASTYLPLRDRWEQSSQKLSNSWKRHEAEADIVGASLCSYMGLNQNTFHKSMISFLKKTGTKAPATSGTVLSARDVANGARLRIPQDVLREFFFPIDSHPSNEERDEQMERLKGLISVDEESVDDSIYARWKDNFDNKRGTLAGASLSLTGGSLVDQTETSSTSITDLNTGKTYTLPEGPSCNHPWHRGSFQ